MTNSFKIGSYKRTPINELFIYISLLHSAISMCLPEKAKVSVILLMFNSTLAVDDVYNFLSGLLTSTSSTII